MSKSDIEININKKIIFSFLGIVVLIAIIIFSLNKYDLNNQLADFKKTQQLLRESEEAKEISALFSKLDISRIKLHRSPKNRYTNDVLYYCSEDSCVGKQNSKLFAEIEAQINAILNKGEDLKISKIHLRAFRDNELRIDIAHDYYNIQRPIEYRFDGITNHFYREKNRTDNDVFKKYYKRGKNKQSKTVVQLENKKFDVFLSAILSWR